MDAIANGYYTRILGEKLERLVDDKFPGQFVVYCDHSSKSQRMVAHVDEACSENNLAYPDIAIVSKNGAESRLVFLAEIEEHKHSPKRFLGDLAALMMSEKVKIGRKDYPMSNVVVVIGLVTNSGGVTGLKAEKFVSKFESLIGEGQGGKRGLCCKLLDADSGEKLVQKVEVFVSHYLANGHTFGKSA